MKKLWLLFPFISLWALWGIGFYVSTIDFIQLWWQFPAYLTLAGIWLMTLFIGMAKYG